MIPKVHLAHYSTKVEVDKKKNDYTDWMIITWDKPLYTVARSSLSWIEDHGNFDSWDIILAHVAGHRKADKSWQPSGHGSLERFGGCTGVAFFIRAFIDMHIEASFEVTLYLDLRELPSLTSTYPVNVEDWQEITHDQAGRMGLY